MKRRATYGLVFALVLVLTTSLAAPLYAAQSQDQTENKDGKTVLTRTWTYLSSETVPEVPPTISQDGATFKLVGTPTPQVTDGGLLKSKTYTHAMMRAVSPGVYAKGQSGLRAEFPRTYHISDGTFSGDILLVNVTAKPVWESLDREVNKTTRITNLPSNEVAGLPTEQEFTITSDESQNATRKATLKRAEVTFEVAGHDQYGIPNNYTAILTFRGVERYLAISHYDATASYKGEVPNSVSDMKLVAVYESEAAAGTATSTPAQQSTKSAPAKRNWLAAVIAAVAALGSGAIIVAVWFSRKNAKLVGHNDEKYASLHIGKGKDARACLIKERVIKAAPDSPSYHVVPKITLTGKGYKLQVFCKETLLYEGDLNEKCELDLQAVRDIRTHKEEA